MKTPWSGKILLGNPEKWYYVGINTSTLMFCLLFNPFLNSISQLTFSSVIKTIEKIETLEKIF